MALFFTLLQISLALVAIAYFFYKRKFNYWRAKGVEGPSPLWLFGNFHEYFLKGQKTVEIEWLQKYGKVYGVYRATRPHLSIADADIARKVLIKDFADFVNRDELIFRNEYWDHNMFNAEDENWKRIRSITSPSFTSGKLKAMAPLIRRSVDKLVQHLDRVVDQKGGQLDAKKSIMGFTINVIASCAFAAEVDANSDDSAADTHPVVEHGMRMFEIDPIRFFALVLCPASVDQFIQKHNIGKAVTAFNYFIKLIRQVVDERKKSNLHNTDLIQLMIDAYVDESSLKDFDFNKLAASMEIDNNNTSEAQTCDGSTKIKDRKILTDKEIVAQCLLFFLAGFETTATTISHCLYELAMNSDVQENLRKSLDEVFEDIDLGSDEYYEALNTKVPYLDACIKETLRKYPPVARLQRRAGRDGVKVDGISLEKDTTVEICVYAIHHNPEYFPQPEEYIPDRFMPENKHMFMNKYFPFGEGPRNCVGMRFAYLEMKYALSRIVRLFEFRPSDKTPVPLELQKFGVMTARNIPLMVTKRS